MSENYQVIQQKRSTIVIHFIVLSVITLTAGWILQSWDFLQSSQLGTLSDSIGLPVIAIAVWILGFWIIFSLLTENWKYKIILHPEHLEIVNFGRFEIPYHQIDSIQIIPMYGVGFKLTDPNCIFETFKGKKSDLTKLKRIIKIYKSTYDCNYCILKKHISIGVESFTLKLKNKGVGIS